MSNPFRAERLGGFIPFCWYGMRLGHWLRLLADGGYDITLNRLPNIIGVTLFSLISSAVYPLSEAIHRRRAEKVEILPPLFVLGHWRSGTTFLHDLLACDPAHAFPTTFECAFPNGFLTSERTLGWALTPFLPQNRAVDDVPVGRDRPFEDEFALAKIGAGSPYLRLAFPRQDGYGARFLDVSGLDEAERQNWEEKFLWLMRRLQLAHPGQRLILKSPPHTARVGVLLKLFPEARFIHIARDPYDIYPSTYRLWKVLNSRFGLHNPANDDAWLGELILSTLPHMYAAYDRDKALVPPGRLVEVRYEDLVADPLGTLGAAYSTLGLGDFATVAPLVADYLAGRGDHTAGTYSLEAAERAAIATRWAGYFDRFGYRRMPQGSA